MTGAAWFGLIDPALQRHARDLASAAEVQERQHKASELSSSAAAQRRILTTLLEKEAKSPVRIQPAAALNSRLTQLAATAKQCGLHVDELRPGTPTTSAEFQHTPLHLSATGSFGACREFLHQLHESFKGVTIDSFSASAESAKAGVGEIAFQLDLIWCSKK